MLFQEAEKWAVFPEELLEPEYGLDNLRNEIEEPREEIIEDMAHARHPDLTPQQRRGCYSSPKRLLIHGASVRTGIHGLPLQGIRLLHLVHEQFQFACAFVNGFNLFEREQKDREGIVSPSDSCHHSLISPAARVRPPIDCKIDLKGVCAPLSHFLLEPVL
jgi:hypothetical protein